MLEADGFEVGDLVGLPEGFDPTRHTGDDIVIRQRPSPTLVRPFGTAIDLTLYDGGSYPEETCPPA
jgi:hypothetical protein